MISSETANNIQVHSKTGRFEGHSIIPDRVKKQHSVRLTKHCELLNTSESTVRRYLNVLVSRAGDGALLLD